MQTYAKGGGNNSTSVALVAVKLAANPFAMRLRVQIVKARNQLLPT